MNGRQVFTGVLLGLAGVALMVVAGGAIVAGDLTALPVLLPGAALVAAGALLVRAGSRTPAPRPRTGARGGGAWGYYLPGPAADIGAAYHDSDRNYGGIGDSGGGWSSGGDSGGGWSSGGGDSGGGGGS